MSSRELTSEFNFSLKTRGIVFSLQSQSKRFDAKRIQDIVCKKVKIHAKHRLWKTKTLDKFTRYLINMINRIDIVHKEERHIENERVAEVMNRRLNDLSWLNDILVIYNHPIQPSITRARYILKTRVFIGLYDLEAGRYDKLHTDRAKLREYLQEDPDRIYPKEYAKKHPTLKLFLQNWRSVKSG